MRDWQRELPPGTLLCGKLDHMFALVINVRVQQLPQWTQLYVLVLTSRAQLLESSLSTESFYDRWLKVET